MSRSLNSLLKKLILLFTLCILSACASVPGGPTKGDPFESYNRAMFGFNEGLDEYILKPVAEGYDAVLPSPVKTGVSNFFSNLGDIFVIINDILQFKFKQAISDTGRFIFNSTIGLYGLIDVSTEFGLPKHHEDFGQTFATWGVGQGPYIVLPFFGSKTLRGTAGFAIESVYDPVYKIENDDVMWSTVALRAVDTRYSLLQASRIVDQAALDKYSFIRDAYLQHRKNLIYDGNPPAEETAPPPKSTEEDLDLEKELGL
ncbi:MAG: VacJ family lipoprotein [Gammaproteobacteria bacterium]|nr:VacJ family lipoprotein [Gammaproteobacteria bacterium]MCW8988334.1 VacJ family lipoprotein [Gammaproteobacteria bacterium]MCW9032125.1 VacJ family lipoprotein [Gammaproteobacteria bacterium]